MFHFFLNNQLHTQKKLVGDLARRTQQIRSNSKRKRIEIENKYVKMENCKKRINDLTSTLEELESQKLNVEERTKRLENMIEVYFGYVFSYHSISVIIYYIYYYYEKREINSRAANS